MKTTEISNTEIPTFDDETLRTIATDVRLKLAAATDAAELHERRQRLEEALPRVRQAHGDLEHRVKGLRRERDTARREALLTGQPAPSSDTVAKAEGELALLAADADGIEQEIADIDSRRLRALSQQEADSQHAILKALQDQVFAELDADLRDVHARHVSRLEFLRTLTMTPIGGVARNLPVESASGLFAFAMGDGMKIWAPGLGTVDTSQARAWFDAIVDRVKRVA